MADTTKNDDTKALDAGDEPQALQSGSDVAAKMLAQQNQALISQTTGTDEVADSDDLAQTLTSLQNIIERNAEEVQDLKKQLKEKRELLRNVFENDAQLAEAKAQVDSFSTQLKERKSKLQTDPQVTSLKAQIGELREQQKEIEEGLSNHLVNYYQLTNSTSFDTSDGDQWDFVVKARVKTRSRN